MLTLCAFQVKEDWHELFGLTVEGTAAWEHLDQDEQREWFETKILMAENDLKREQPSGHCGVADDLAAQLLTGGAVGDWRSNARASEPQAADGACRLMQICPVQMVDDDGLHDRYLEPHTAADEPSQPDAIHPLSEWKTPPKQPSQSQSIRCTPPKQALAFDFGHLGWDEPVAMKPIATQRHEGHSVRRGRQSVQQPQTTALSERGSDDVDGGGNTLADEQQRLMANDVFSRNEEEHITRRALAFECSSTEWTK